MKKSRLFNIAYYVATIGFIILSLALEYSVDFTPKFPWHPVFSIIGMIYVLILVIIGFVSALKKLIDILIVLRSKVYE